jgi:hypothetical protein
MEFLRNYIGDDYAEVLTTLEDRHVVVFGRGVTTTNPVLVHVNDWAEFQTWWNAQGIDVGIEPDDQETEPPTEQEVEDDL